MKTMFNILLFIVASSVFVKAEIRTDPAKVVPPKIEKAEEVVAHYFEYLFKKGDFDALSKIIAKGAVYHQAEGLPYGGTFIGFEQWTTMYLKAQTYYNLQISVEPTYYASSANAGDVVINFTIKCISKKTSKEITMPISEYFKVRDGMITEIRAFYFDTKTFTEFLQ